MPGVAQDTQGHRAAGVGPPSPPYAPSRIAHSVGLLCAHGPATGKAVSTVSVSGTKRTLIVTPFTVPITFCTAGSPALVSPVIGAYLAEPVAHVLMLFGSVSTSATEFRISSSDQLSGNAVFPGAPGYA